MSSKSSFYTNSAVTNTQSVAIEASVDNAAASATASAASATAAANSATTANNAITTTTANKNSSETAQASATASASTATTKASEASASAVASEASKVTSGNSSAASATSATASATSATASATSATASSNSATASDASKVAAQTAQSNAETAETNAETAETNAEAAQAASEAARDASVVAKNASETAKTASETAETNSETAATNSANSATASASSATASANSASSAQTSNVNSGNSATASATSATASANSATASDASKVAAQTAKTNAETAETNAETAETNAASSASAASSSASSASSSAATATTKAGEASTSETNAAASQSSATASAATATTQAGIATTKASEASTSATNAASSASSAQASKDAALAALDSFDDRYLGQKSSNPTTDNDGNALVAGALFFDTTSDVMKVYEGSSWVAAYASVSGSLIAASNLSDLASVSGARTNLGLGTAATTAATDYATAAQGTLADNALPKAGGAMTGAITTNSTFDGRDVATDGTKLDGIEAGATADQTSAEIRSLVESASDSNVFTDADHTKLNSIEASANVTDTANVVAALTAGTNVAIASDGTISSTDTNTTYSVGDGGLTQNNFTDADHTKLNGIEASANVTDTANVVAALTAGTNVAIAANGTISSTDTNTTYSVGDGGLTQKNFTTTLKSKLDGIETSAKDDQTITAGSGLSGGGTGNVTLNHADTSSVANANNSGNTFIQDINFDTYGHVTSVGTGTVSVGNGTLTVQGTGALGGSGTFTANQSGNTTVSISHDDTSSQGSSNNSGRTYIQDITLDTYGHVTGLATATETVVNTDTNTNLTHTGEVTGSTSLTIANNVVDEANLKVSNSPTNGYFLSAQSGNTGGLTWAEAGGGAITHLGTLNPTASATSLTLSSLNLTGYKQVHIMFKNINQSGNEYFTLNALNAQQANWSVGKIYTGGGVNQYGSSFMVTCDLTTGVAYSSPVASGQFIAAAFPLNVAFWSIAGSGTTVNSWGNPNPNITTSTTSIVVACRPGRTFFSADNSPSGAERDIAIYGVA